MHVKDNKKPRSDLPDRVKAILKDPTQLSAIMEEGTNLEVPSSVELASDHGDQLLLPEIGDLEVYDDHPEFIPDDEIRHNYILSFSI